MATVISEKRCPRFAERLLGLRTVAEFFAGIGLMRLGLEREGWTVVFANDMDNDKYTMYSRHFGKDDSADFLVEDIHKMSAQDVPTVALATASFPCLTARIGHFSFLGSVPKERDNG